MDPITVSWVDPILWDVMKHLVFRSGILSPKSLKMARQVCRLWYSWVAFPSIRLSPKRLASVGDDLFSAYLQHVETVYFQEFEINDIPILVTSPIMSPPSGRNKLRRIFFDSSTVGPYGAKLLAQVLSNNKNIEEMNLRFCNIGNEGVAEICSMLSSNSTLKKIDFTSNQITFEGAKCISDLLKRDNISLQSLTLSQDALTPAGLDLIADALKTNTSLQRLVIMLHNDTGPFQTELLAEAIKTTKTLREIKFGPTMFSPLVSNALAINNSIKHISVNQHAIDLNGITALANMLNVNFSLETLDLAYTPLRDDGASIIAQPLLLNRSLTSLNLSYAHLSNAGTISLATMLQANATLLQLDLSGNNIAAEGISALGQALSTNNTLTSLNLSSNVNIGAEPLAGFAAGLAANRSLLELILDRANIPDHGGIAIAQAISANQTLQRLRCANNHFGPAAIAAFSTALASNTSLVHLDLSSTTAELAPQITAGLAANRSLQTFILRHCSISDTEATYLARALKQNRTLTHLDVEYNEIGVAGMVELSSALSQNDTIARLNVAHNEIGDVGAIALAEVLQRKATPIEVNVTSNKISRGGEGALALDQAKRKNLNLSLEWAF
eukprot:TRINITY_DN10609_c0_g1_i1.p1 TRINITY_DN10609_c0_g1~~TRINITY_DN10609_c0_g1_i1.p1  ORF type:complete len:614 (+),score=101.42 TRINITY_DN10609_c0_g1_i1:101-1942(+)